MGSDAALDIGGVPPGEAVPIQNSDHLHRLAFDRIARISERLATSAATLPAFPQTRPENVQARGVVISSHAAAPAPLD